MSKLLKRLSGKNLRKRFNSESGINPPDIPSLPASRSLSYTAFTPHIGHEEEAAVGAEIAESWTLANHEATISAAGRAIEAIEGQATNTVLTGQLASVQAGITTILNDTGTMDSIEKGVHGFMEGSAVLMNALDEVAKIHPFIGIAVMAFKTVWTLEMKRRDNDKKIIALHVEMKDMMAVLIQLKNVNDPNEIAPDGTTIKGRMEDIIQRTANDIKDCANACDTYSKKKLIVKLLKGPIWEGKLVKFAGVFTQRRSEFEFAMSIHTAVGVDAANKTLASVDDTTRAMEQKMDLMMQMFQKIVSPEQKDMLVLVKQRGGVDAVQKNDNVLRELSDYERDSNPSAHSSPSSHHHSAMSSSAFDDLKEDLHTDPDDAIKDNMAVFSRKFEIQKRQIVEELTRVIRREGDRVINAVTSGPHDRIVDPDVHLLWKDMGWRGNVKARHFVLAIRDYFLEKWRLEAETNGKPSSDGWTFAYLTVMRLQPISEAFDDDASGFITVAEVNTLTTSRPADWSLPHWMAYWAVGWHFSMVKYQAKIQALISKMFTILPHILPANRAGVHDYIIKVYEVVTTIVASVNVCNDTNEALQARFSTYVDAEEARLKGNLEAVEYDIDAEDTLSLVVGPGRIEKYILPLLYLLLNRHFEMFRMCQTRIAHPDEFWDAADTLGWALNAVVKVRARDLTILFTQQKQDLNQQFKSFANGLFDYIHDPMQIWAPATVKSNSPAEEPYDDSVEDQSIRPQDVLNYPFDQEELDWNAYRVKPEQITPKPQSTSPLSKILGSWNGYLYDEPSAIVSSTGMINLNFHANSYNNHGERFETSGRFDSFEFSVTGHCIFSDIPGCVDVEFKMSFPARLRPKYFSGRYDPESGELSGAWGYDENPTSHECMFVFKRIPEILLCFRPAPEAFHLNRPRALWSYALSAILYHVGRRAWTSTFFSQRADIRRRLIELLIRNDHYGRPLDEDEQWELCELRNKLTSTDSRFYHSLVAFNARRITNHDLKCASCTGMIGGARIICLVCQSTDTFHTLNLCDSSQCNSATINQPHLQKPHRPTHDVVKVRRVVFTRQFGRMDGDAREALRRCRALFPKHRVAAAGVAKGLSVVTSGIHVGKEKDPNSAFSPVTPHTARFSFISPQPVAEKSGPSCGICKQTVIQPCWFCVKCTNDVFICMSCDEKGPAHFDDHRENHDLVRCQPYHPDIDASMEGRMGTLESSFTKHEKVIEQKLKRLESKVDDRLGRLESLMESMLTQMSELSASLPSSNK